ncbi:MAG: hypothetical protein Q9226_005615 [Calogaya cf. arnoldii]
MDELFFLPAAPVVLPRAYWLDPDHDVAFSSAIMLLQPSFSEYSRIADAVAHAGRQQFDMEIINTLYNNSAPTLPHRPYALLSRVFRWKNHTNYLGNPKDVWDPVAILKETKYLHFSEWPLPKVRNSIHSAVVIKLTSYKPWIRPDPNLVKEHWPPCTTGDTATQTPDCSTRKVWLELYRDYRRRRNAICGLDAKNIADVVDF